MTAAGSAVPSRQVDKAGGERASTPNYCWKLGCFSKSQLASTPPCCTGGVPSIFLKAQTTASDTREKKSLFVESILKDDSQHGICPICLHSW